MNEIIERMRRGERITETDADFPRLCEEVENTRRLVGELNTGYHSHDEVRVLLERIWGAAAGCLRAYVPAVLYGFRQNDPCGQRRVHQLRLHISRPRRHHTRRRRIHRAGSKDSDGASSRRTGFAASAASQARSHPLQRLDRCGSDDTAGRNRRRERHRRRRSRRDERRTRQCRCCRSACQSIEKHKNRSS